MARKVFLTDSMACSTKLEMALPIIGDSEVRSDVVGSCIYVCMVRT